MVGLRWSGTVVVLPSCLLITASRSSPRHTKTKIGHKTHSLNRKPTNHRDCFIQVRIQKTTMAYDSKMKLSLIIAVIVSVRVRVGVIMTIVIVILMRIIAIVLISILDDSEQNTHALNKIDFPCQNTIVLSLDTKGAS